MALLEVLIKNKRIGEIIGTLKIVSNVALLFALDATAANKDCPEANAKLPKNRLIINH